MNRKIGLVALSSVLLALAACGKSNSAPVEDNASSKPAETKQETSTDIKEAAAASSGSYAPDSPALADMSIGSEDAPVTLIEYASVTCPGCASFHEYIFPRLKEEYIETGKVRFVFREFPTPPAQLSYIGFIMSRCAADEAGAPGYFAMVDTLFKNQQSWISENWQSEFLKYASVAGMNEADFKACIGRQEVVDRINQNIKEGNETYEISGTPSFVLNGKVMGPYASIDDYFAKIDAAIEAAGAQ